MKPRRAVLQTERGGRSVRARERRTVRPTRKPELDHGYYRASTASRWYDTTIGLGMAFETKGLRKILWVSWKMDSRENK